MQAVEMKRTMREQLSVLLGDRSGSTVKDLKINLERLLDIDDPGTRSDMMLAMLSLATATGCEAMVGIARANLSDDGIEREWIAESTQAAAIMGMLTTYYRFRHMMTDASTDGTLNEAYRQAGLRMTTLARPAMGKTRFEKLAFALSVLYGCPSCVVSHEQTLRSQGVREDEIHNLAKLAAAVKGIAVLLDSKGERL